jgi:ribonuclease P protein component
MERVTREGKRIRTDSLELRWMASPLGHPAGRVGFIVPRYGETAVARNRLKRRLREIARVEILPRMGSLDAIIRARAVAYRVTFAELRRELTRMGDRLVSGVERE